MTIANEHPALSNSLWTATTREQVTCPMLTGETEADICIIGGGITGLSAALRAQAAGRSVIVLESQSPGWGASGRNGGQVLPGLKENPREVEARFGEMGRRMIAASGAAPQLVFDLIATHGIDCDPRREGWIHAATGSGLAEARDRAAQWRVRGAEVRDLDAAQTKEMLGGGIYDGALLDLRGGSVNPQAYATGLARAALAAGIRIHGDSPVAGLQAVAGGWCAETPSGKVTAREVALCTNGYSGPLDERLRSNVVPVRSIQIATDPLPDTLLPDILPGRQVASDTQKSLLYFRRDAENRFVMGGAGAYDEAGLERAFARLKDRAQDLFPQLDGTRWRYGWGGFVAITADHLPHLAELAPGLHAALGFNGRGVAMATALGGILGDRLSGTPAEDLDFPTRALRPFPLQRFHRQGVKMVLLMASLQDHLHLR